MRLVRRQVGKAAFAAATESLATSGVPLGKTPTTWFRFAGLRLGNVSAPGGSH
jgi:hypothetical protein